jgi:uncharacterized protein YcbK (DUF882 family)
MPNDRRDFLRRLGALAVTAVAAPLVAPGKLLADTRSERVLSFFHTHTGDRVTVPYFADGTYLRGGLLQLNDFLKDFRTGDEHAMDPGLFDILNDLKLATGSKSEFQVISAYRSPRTNAMLHARSRGVASGSMHVEGRAIDIRLADVKTSVLRDAALELRRGGVGYYADSDFVHVDTGRVRRW